MASPRYSGPIAAALAARPAAIVGVTEGPTGECIALNVAVDAPRWPVPIALIGSRDAERLQAGGAPRARLVQSGRTSRALAHNVLARRAGRGPTLVVSTPTSGWFGCAGERGAGVALFLALARHCAQRITRPLLFVATSGHEFEGLGSRILLGAHAPDPSTVGAWIHIGANVAGGEIDLSRRPFRATGRAHRPRGVGATALLHPATLAAYRGLRAYDPPVLLDARNAVGDLAHYLEAGYSSLMGIVGAHPLHHTRLDVPELVTSPMLLEEALSPLVRVVEGITRGDRGA